MIFGPEGSGLAGANTVNLVASSIHESHDEDDDAGLRDCRWCLRVRSYTQQ